MALLRETFTIIILLLFLLCAYRFFTDPNALRDDSTAAQKPYSFARVQLWWWTIVILATFVAGYGFYGTMWPFNETCLALLGISLATTTAGRIIDNQQVSDENVQRHQDTCVSEGFFNDILSDENGLSVHRFQAAFLNLIYSGAFVIETLSNNAFPTFDAQTLGLLGISSSAYLALKANEGKGNFSAPTNQPPTPPAA